MNFLRDFRRGGVVKVSVKLKPNKDTMKLFKTTIQLLTATVIALPLSVFAADEKKAEKPTPYPLKTCVVSGEEIDEKGAMKPHVFTHEGREIKLCCKSCLKDFNKDTAKYLKKLDGTEKKEKK